MNSLLNYCKKPSTYFFLALIEEGIFFVVLIRTLRHAKRMSWNLNTCDLFEILLALFTDLLELENLALLFAILLILGYRETTPKC